MENLTQTLGLIGTVLVAGAYAPQIWHLVKRHCAYGISLKAWFVWLIAALLLLPRAISSNDLVFIILFLVQIVAISCVFGFSYFHQEKTCEDHKIL